MTETYREDLRSSGIGQRVTLEDGIDRLSRKFGTYLPTHAA